jgi:hypothetical protein
MEHFDSDYLRSQIRDSTFDLFSKDLVGRIWSQFYELTWSELDGIPVSVLFHITSHHLLTISSEDAFFRTSARVVVQIQNL